MNVRSIIAATLMTGLTAGCATAMNDTNVSIDQTAKTTVSGEVHYLPRIALPPYAELSVMLLNSSLENPSAHLLAGTTVPLNGKQVPIPFTFDVDHSAIDLSEDYEVRAIIRSEAGDIIWRTKKGHKVGLSTRNYNTGKLELVMVDIENPANASPLASVWIVENINGGGVIDNSNVTITFGSEGKVSGSGGCNYFSGDYEASEHSLVIASGIAMTQKACAPALMNQDQKLLAVLQNAENYSVNDGVLTILDKNGRAITARR